MIWCWRCYLMTTLIILLRVSLYLIDQTRLGSKRLLDLQQLVELSKRTKEALERLYLKRKTVFYKRHQFYMLMFLNIYLFLEVSGHQHMKLFYNFGKF
ncbi:hypothetical protein POPTR_001G181601v4 [Populus trichocarpa]|uniref:Uncharacterized protein n=1 Tax=Populus trichocarpa TaxID=3694 RepID=A0ACC0TJV2_POPTR|nr:hypothetical protein POPTR_001G181601v4 [Populus trichocarpa]